jgi:hypothetical protein
MKNTNTATLEKSIGTENLNLELNKVGVHAVSAASLLIGCWAVACLASATISSGGISGLASNFVSAFVG